MKTYVYIDGGNLYHILKNCGFASSDYDFHGFVKSLLGKDDQLLGVRYYIGQVKRVQGNPKSESIYSAQQRFFEKLKQKGFSIIRGEIHHNKGIFYEKGVDVKIAIDLVEGAYENRYEKAILITSDSDLAPAAAMVNQKKKEIVNIGFKERKSIALFRCSSAYQELDKKYLQQFCPSTLDIHSKSDMHLEDSLKNINSNSPFL